MYHNEYSIRYIRIVPTAPTTRRYAKRLPREERREQILDTTLGLIARDGWSALRINRVADEAGIAKSVIYAIFGSMEGLQQAVMRREQERAFALAGQAIEAARGGTDPGRAIDDGLAVFLAGVAANPTTWRLVLAPAENTPPTVRAAILEGRERWRQEIQGVLGALIGNDESDVELVSYVVRGNIENFAGLIIDDPDRFTPERISKLATRITDALINA